MAYTASAINTVFTFVRFPTSEIPRRILIWWLIDATRAAPSRWVRLASLKAPMTADQPPIRVIIGEDHPFARQGLEMLLSADPYITIIGTSDSFVALLKHPGLTDCEVLLLDVGGMGDGPMVMVSQLLRAAPQLRIVIFATSVDMAPELLNVGAIGYVAKDDPVEYLITAIRAAKAGQRAVSPIVQRYLDQNTGRRKRFRITPREEVVLKLLAQGLRTPEVAEHMSIDLGTTQNHVTAMLRKTGCKDRMQLVIWYLRVYLEADSLANDRDDPNDVDDLDDPDDPDDPDNPESM
ncbi:MAG: response regulator transcription factor [Blastochloris sp.]|nr:response regulator transcription factor [Blastochloris sp.]